jgi:ABC-type transporter Mla subunit MlaD
MNEATLIVFTVFAAVITLSFVIQTILWAGMFAAVRKSQEKLHALIQDVRIHALPVLNTTRAFMDDLSPQVKTIVSNVAETSDHVRNMSKQANGVVEDVAARAHAQAEHVDHMVQGTLDQISQAGCNLQHGVAAPMRRLNGIVNGVRAGWSVLRRKDPPGPDGSDGDLFI